MIRLIVIILAIAFVPLIVSGVSALVVDAIHGVSHGINGLFAPLCKTGEPRLEGLIRLCLYLITVTLLVRFLLGR
ncbi:MAG: hypothetical protein SWQ30_16370 [Thermodesulfobacteriota bacterium]|nr:hypothetical protein [Thermodesulfobacteriota bacterium]